MGLASASGSRVLLAVCLFDGLCERLMGLSSVSGSRILLAVFVCVSFSGCLCVCVCVILGVAVLCVCVVLCVGVSRLCFAASGALAARPTWQLGRRGNGDAVAQAKERGWDASKAVCSQLRKNLSMEALSMATTMAWGSRNDACCPAAA